jgi:SprT-like family
MAMGLREAWLLNAVEHLKPIFERAGYFLPEVRVSVGFPSTGARSRHIGQCWSTSASADNINQIFIAPQESDSVEVLDTLTHELVHAVDDCKNGHGEKFKEIALAVGLKGPMRSAGANEFLRQELVRIAEKLGKYPHPRLSVPSGSPRSQTKRPGARCPKCGYEIVMLKKFLAWGAPICPKDKNKMLECGEWAT